MGNRNKLHGGNITKFPWKTGKFSHLKISVRDLGEEIIGSFREMIHSKTDALNWAVDQLPSLLEAAGLSDLSFDIAPGLIPFFLNGFSSMTEDDSEDEEMFPDDDFGGTFPCFIAEDNLPDGVARYILLLVVDAETGEENEEPTEEGEHRIDLFLTREDEDGAVYCFDGEGWQEMEDLFETMDDDADFEEDAEEYDGSNPNFPFALSDFDLPLN